MAVIEEFHVDDIGTEIRFRITDSGAPVDLSTADLLEATVISPGGVRFTGITLSATSDTAKTLALGWCQFPSTAAHLDAQDWIQFQARIVDGASDGHTSTARRRVFRNL